MKKALFLISVLLVSGSLCGIQQLFSLETLVVSSLEDKINLTPYLEYFIDNTTELNINDLITGAGDDLFKSPEKKILNLGYTPKPIWIRFSLNIDRSVKKKLILEIENEFLQNIDIYYLNSLNEIVYFSKTGLNRGFDSKNIPNGTFAWDLSVLLICDHQL